MLNTATLAALVIILSLVLLIMLFGELPQFKDSIIGRMRQSLMSVPEAGRILDNKYFGGQLSTTIQTLWKRLEEPLRWTVPIGYLALMSACFYFFETRVEPRIVDAHSLHRILVLTAYSLPYMTILPAIFTDPGRIISSNHVQALKLYPYDCILFMPNTECRTCLRTKPARSKHCSTCGYCISGCDHHCIFLNNCVGHNNQRWFLLFVLQNCIVLAYGFYLTRGVLSNLAASYHGRFWIQRWVIAITATKDNRIAGSLLLLCLLLGVVSTAFLVEQLRYIYLGATTNETMKWEDMKLCIQDGEMFFYDHPTEELRTKSHELNEPSIVLQRQDNEYNRPLTQRELQRIDAQNLVLKQLTGFAQINNIYDTGFWNNFRQRIFPKPL